MIRTLCALMGAIVLIGAAARVDRSSPAAVVNGFYAWYMKNSWSEHIAGTKPYFAPQLYRNFATVLHAQDCMHDAIIDWDPFNGTQIGTVGYSVGTPSVRGTTATVPVTVKVSLSPQRPAQSKHVKVIAVQGWDGWRIADVRTPVPDKSTLAGIATDLQSAVKRLPSETRKVTPTERACLAKPA